MAEKEHPARVASKRSMSCAERKSKEEWLSLFADDAIIEDPVGRSPLDKEGKGHRGKQALSAFYDRHIAVSGRRFEITDSFACGQEVANVGKIHKRVRIIAEGALRIAETLRPTSDRYFYWGDDGHPWCSCSECPGGGPRGGQRGL